MRVGLQTRADRTLFFESYRQPGTVFPQSHRQTVALSSLCPTGNQLLCLPLSHRQPGAVFPLSHRQPGALSSLCPTDNLVLSSLSPTDNLVLCLPSVPQATRPPSIQARLSRPDPFLSLSSVPGAIRCSVFPQSQGQPGALSSLSPRSNQVLCLPSVSGATKSSILVCHFDHLDAESFRW